MKAEKYHVQINVQPICLLYLVCIVCFSSWRTAFYSIIAMLLHESGHLVIAAAMHANIKCIYITPFGGMIDLDDTTHKGVRGILLAAGGPMANLLCIMLIGTPVWSEFFAANDAKLLVAANFTMLAFNCMPALPLDGGRILFAVGYYILPISLLTSILSAMGVALGSGMILAAFYGLLTLGKINSSLLIIGIYMIIEARREKNRIIVENAFTVILERKREKQSIRKVKAYRLAPNTKVIKLLEWISGPYEAVFLIDFDDQRYVLYEEDVYDYVMHEPQNSIERIIEALHNENV